jgi:hypothetical protein
MLDIPMPEPRLKRAGIVPGVGQGIAASVTQHVRVNWEGHAGPFAKAVDQGVEALRRHRPARSVVNT